MDSGQDDSLDAATADEAVIPAEIMIEHQVEGFRFARVQGLSRPVLNLGLQAAAAHRSRDPAIGVKEGLGSDFLRTRSLHRGDDAERHGFIGLCCRAQGFIKCGHDS